MECKFSKHGLSISYDQIVKPCCAWKIDNNWRSDNHLSNTNIINWHNSAAVADIQTQLSNNQWPSACNKCSIIEDSGRQDSMRGNGNHSYAAYNDNDITLEIRPGSTCNFACQTCWPEASSRVAKYHSMAGLIDIKSINSNRMDNFDFLIPIAGRIKDIVLLGGEPFYDKACIKFLAWAQEHVTSNITMFTNGSYIDFEFVRNFKGRLTLVFSIDAVEKAAEYVRVGTVWDDVLSNYARAKELATVRVNITCSVYNYHHIESVIQLLVKDWPEVVSFGQPGLGYMKVGTIPAQFRQDIVDSLYRSIELIKNANVEIGQHHNAINALSNIIADLNTVPWDPAEHARLCKYVDSMDRVKGMQAKDYCTTLEKILGFKSD